MKPFQRKSIESNRTLGERLRGVREERGDDVVTMAQRTRIQRAYLEAIENGQYGSLPGEVYIRNYLKAYAIALELNPMSVLGMYEKEKRILVKGSTRARRTPGTPAHISRARFVSLPRFLKRAALLPVIGVAVVYLALQIIAILTPPNLEVFEPTDSVVVRSRTIDIVGKTDAGSAVTINNQPVLANPNGFFTETIHLNDGMNVVEVASAKDHSREATVYRRILVEDAATALHQ